MITQNTARGARQTTTSSGGESAQRSAERPQERIRGAAYRSSSSSMASLGAAMERRVAAAARGRSRGGGAGAGSPRHGCCGQRALRSPRGGIARTLPPPAGPCPHAGGLDAATITASTTQHALGCRRPKATKLASDDRVSRQRLADAYESITVQRQRAARSSPHPRTKRRGGSKNVPDAFFCEGFRRKCRGTPASNTQQSAERRCTLTDRGSKS